MIDSNIKMIVVIPKRRRRDEILKRRVAIRLGIKRRDPSANRIDKEIRDLISGERLLSKRIDRLSEKRRREIARALRKRGDVCDSSYSFANASAFVIGKEERAISYDRAAKRTAKLVALIFRSAFACGREEVSRIKRRVAKELERRPVKRIRA